MPDKWLEKVARLGSQTDAIIEKTLQAGADVVLPKVKSNLQGVVGRGTKQPSQSTGELVDSLGTTSVSVDHKGVHNIKIGFNEPRRQQHVAKGKRSYSVRTNAMVANVLEYGRHGQPAKPFLKPARSASRKSCIEAMKQTFASEAEKL